MAMLMHTWVMIEVGHKFVGVKEAITNHLYHYRHRNHHRRHFLFHYCKLYIGSIRKVGTYQKSTTHYFHLNRNCLFQVQHQIPTKCKAKGVELFHSGPTSPYHLILSIPLLFTHRQSTRLPTPNHC